MQKTLIAAIAMMISVATFGQKEIVWFDVGLKAQYGFTGLYNSAIADSKEYDYKISNGYSFGGKLGINFGYNGIAIDVMMSQATQEFDVVEFPDVAPSIDWNALDVYVLYRNAKNLGYFEIGPKISFIRGVEGSATGIDPVDIKEEYNSNAISGVIGFGANVMGTDGAFSGILGLRFEYGFTDMVSDFGQEAAAPLGDPTVYAEDYSSSIPIFAGIVFELNWGVGAFAVAQCGGRPKFIMF